MTVAEDGFVGVDERVLCLGFGVQHSPLLLVEQEEYDEDMILMRTIYQRSRYSWKGCHYRVTPRYYRFQSLKRPSIPAHEPPFTSRTISANTVVTWMAMGSSWGSCMVAGGYH